MGRRAESLAARIDEGAARLADCAEGLSDAGWHHLARIRAALGR
jgi:hypothetical protein